MVRDPQSTWRLFSPLWADVTADTDFFKQRPLLAHYTTTYVLEQIAKHNEIWFSNPLLMNDIEEVRVGINEGTNFFLASETLATTLSAIDRETFEKSIVAEYNRFNTDHAFDTYILCLCEHDADDGDGLLSMWRGYGDSGKGVAIVFDAREIPAAQNTPLIVAKVVYGTEAERHSWLEGVAQRFVDVVRTNALTGSELQVAASALFQRLRVFALFTKHRGFSEEREWRLAYLPERDTQGVLKKHLSYFNGPRGVEPKLKLPIAPVTEVLNAPFSLDDLVHSIILGPSNSSPLAVASIKRMLASLNRTALVGRVAFSRIPYRPSSQV